MSRQPLTTSVRRDVNATGTADRVIGIRVLADEDTRIHSRHSTGTSGSGW
jgi:hypothetical protein